MGVRSFTIKRKGDGMVRLDEELKKSQENILVRKMSVEDFYCFFDFLKEVLPVMNLIAEKYEKENEQSKEEIMQKMKDLQLTNSIGVFTPAPSEKWWVNIDANDADIRRSNNPIDPQSLDQYRVKSKTATRPKKEE